MQYKLNFRFAEARDADLYFHWANDDQVRKNSYSQEKIDYQSHIEWFNKIVSDNNSFMYLFQFNEDMLVGQVRIMAIGDEAVIGVSVDSNFRGRGLASDMIRIASDDFLEKFPGQRVLAYIKTSNVRSERAFQSAGFRFEQEVEFKSVPSKLFVKTRQ